MSGTWEYRVIRELLDFVSYSYTVREVYSNPAGYSTDADSPFGETREEFLSDFQAFARALTKPVLMWQAGGFIECEPPMQAVGTIHDPKAVRGE